ncbi:hypothetical protein DFH09DRAFT_1294708 [Mycena vulgaris]|nr:hypothetical protein DFH09DRAFT_1294708 [Mycena vulgaris]
MRRWDNPSPTRRSSTVVPLQPTETDNPSEPEEDDECSSSPSLGRTNNPRKRPAEDVTQFADSTARNLRLKLSGAESLRQYAKMSAGEQSVWLAAHMLLHTELMESLQPPEIVWHMPPVLEGYIDQYSFLALIDPKTSTYVKKGKGGPVDRLTNFLLKLPASGLTTAIINDKPKARVVTDRLRTKLTHMRNAIKDVIGDSFGDKAGDSDDPASRPLDIVALCQRVVALGANKQPTEVKVSLEMCGRFAFLRETYSTLAKNNPGSKATDFWAEVDKDLVKMREAKSNDEVRISQCIAYILADDRQAYGTVNLENLITESPISLS